MGLILKHVKQGPSGYTYRRRVPRDVEAVIGRCEFKKALGPTHAAAVRAYPHVHAAFDRVIAEARAQVAADARRAEAEAGATGLEAWGLAGARTAEYLDGFRPRDCEDAGSIIADHILARYVPGYPRAYVRRDEYGHEVEPEPVGVPEVERMTAAILRGSTTPPEPTLEDAHRLYLKERLVDGAGARVKEAQRLDRVFKGVRAALGASRTLRSLRREDAKKVRDYMAGLPKRTGEVREATSVRRELNLVKAVVNHALREFDLAATVDNPFTKLAVEGAPEVSDGEADKRDPLPPKVLAAHPRGPRDSPPPQPPARP